MLLAILLIAYYSGGYVAGRMSRFDGARQGLMVWVIGLLVTLLAAALGWIAGDQYNLLDRVDVPRIPIPTDEITLGGIITADRRTGRDAARRHVRREGRPSLPLPGGPRRR